MTLLNDRSTPVAPAAHVDRDSRVLRLDSPGPLGAGVAASGARRLGASPLIVRVAFLLLALAGGVGAVLYLVLWALGVESEPARRQSLRHDLGIVALTASALAVVFVLVDSVAAQVVGPLAFVSFALALSAGSSMRSDLRSGRAFGRLGAGLLLMFGGLIAGAAALGSLGQVWLIAAAAGAIVVGVSVVLGPWFRHLLDGAFADRVERIRVEARADFAAHLHDSVLQTLTLIQNRADEPEVTASLAHQQERELRRWLYESGHAEAGSDSLRARLTAIVAAIEDDYAIVVDTVFVGDCVPGAAVEALVGAVREALVNAAKFAGTRQVSLYVEADQGHALAFVRDRGVGFVPSDVPSDRRGIADSIQGRLERVGGAAAIKSAPNSGTEVRIEVAW